MYACCVAQWLWRMNTAEIHQQSQDKNQLMDYRRHTTGASLIMRWQTTDF